MTRRTTKPTIFLRIIGDDPYPSSEYMWNVKRLVHESLGPENWGRWRYEDYWANHFILVWEKLSDKAVLMLLQHPDKFVADPELYNEILGSLF